MARRSAMTEAEWDVCQDSYLMLRPCRRMIRDRPRKGRLLAVGCCRRIWHLLSDRRSRAAVDVAARYADGRASVFKLCAAEQAAEAAHAAAFQTRGKVGASAEWAAQFAASFDAWSAAQHASSFAYVAVDGLELGPEKTAQSDLFRCIFGPLPFRSVTVDPVWLTANRRRAAKLARSIYKKQTFERLPELADALVAAGCDDRDLLNHCRSDKPHVRGCWVVDLVLGTE